MSTPGERAADPRAATEVRIATVRQRTPAVERTLSDLRAEGEFLDAVIATSNADLSRPTPAKGWNIGDQLGHLHWADRVSALACRDPAGFARQAEAFRADPVGAIQTGTATEARRSRDDLLSHWRAGRADLLTALGELPAGVRIPWFGPAMGAGTMASARIMETWAHGVDITDALGLDPAATARLRHVADLGVRTRDFAFSVHGRLNPSALFRLELTAPDGDRWTWGPVDAVDWITGPALDFCLLVTQRRHRDDLALVSTAGPADEWLSIAQVFAGPPGEGRQPQVRI